MYNKDFFYCWCFFIYFLPRISVACRCRNRKKTKTTMFMNVKWGSYYNILNSTIRRKETKDSIVSTVLTVPICRFVIGQFAGWQDPNERLYFFNLRFFFFLPYSVSTLDLPNFWKFCPIFWIILDICVRLSCPALWKQINRNLQIIWPVSEKLFKMTIFFIQ